MLYLFTNDSYGLPFIRQAVAWQRQTRLPITIVLSGKSGAAVDTGVLRRCRRQARQHFRNLWRSWTWGLPINVVLDVNHTGFAHQIPESAVGIICGFNQIFPADLIERFRELVNFHPSLLPLYRGPVPSRWCLRNHETQTGYTLHRVTTAIDAGELLYQEIVSITANDTDKTLDAKIATAAAPTMTLFLEHLRSGKPWQKKLVDARACYRVPVDYVSFPGREPA